MGQLSIVPTKPRGQLLKWIGSKYKFAHLIVSYFPEEYRKFIEPFVGSGAIIGTMCPEVGIAGDTLTPLIEIWKLVQNNPEKLIEHYTTVMEKFEVNRKTTYAEVLRRYNSNPNGPDLVIISRTCYGGVVRFTRENKISTPIGPHKPISGESFAHRVQEWRDRVRNVHFLNESFQKTMSYAEAGDFIYCDPPYLDSQSILYGAQRFDFAMLLESIERSVSSGARVALSIDGKKKSGEKFVTVQIPDGLFAREIFIDVGSSMLRRFQKEGEQMEGENVHERLLLTW